MTLAHRFQARVDIRQVWVIWEAFRAGHMARSAEIDVQIIEGVREFNRQITGLLRRYAPRNDWRPSGRPSEAIQFKSLQNQLVTLYTSMC